VDTDELVSHLRTILGIEIPKGTLRRWAFENLIPSSKPKGQKGRRGRFVSWPQDTVEQATAVYVLRNTKIPWAKTTRETLLAAKSVVDRFYALISDFCETENQSVLRKFNELLKPIESAFFAAPEGKGYMYGGVTLNPLVVTWITTLEKVRHNRPVFEPATVVFNWNWHVVLEGGEELLKKKYDGVSFEPSDGDTIRRHGGHTPEALEKRRERLLDRGSEQSRLIGKGRGRA
jgi:hypothetical protein